MPEISLINNPRRDQWNSLVQRPQISSDTLGPAVQEIMNRVREHGDQALRDYSQKFDGVDLDSIAVSVLASTKEITLELKEAIDVAYQNIWEFHQSQLALNEPKVETMPGVSCWRKALPIEKVGLYIPGGTAPLFSSLLMLGIPARLAGCPQITVCTPPDAKGKLHPALLYIARKLELKQLYRVGGAQAVAAMAYGTETVPAVYKIFGPGNQYVTHAKQCVALEGIAIDFPAGPSEVAIIADHQADPAFLAADLLSQAEHGPDSQVVLVSNSEKLFQAVNQQLQLQLATLPRAEVAARALDQSLMIRFDDLEVGMEFINRYAPEHLIIQTQNPLDWGEKVRNAGSVFLGPYTPESVGDYASGTNHTLPTNGHARAYAGVSVDNYLRKVTFQSLTKTGLTGIASTVENLADAEGLEAHRRAVAIRISKSGGNERSL